MTIVGGPHRLNKMSCLLRSLQISAVGNSLTSSLLTFTRLSPKSKESVQWAETMIEKAATTKLKLVLVKISRKAAWISYKPSFQHLCPLRIILIHFLIYDGMYSRPWSWSAFCTRALIIQKEKSGWGMFHIVLTKQEEYSGSPLAETNKSISRGLPNLGICEDFP